MFDDFESFEKVVEFYEQSSQSIARLCSRKSRNFDKFFVDFRWAKCKKFSVISNHLEKLWNFMNNRGKGLQDLKKKMEISTKKILKDVEFEKIFRSGGFVF